MRALRRATKEEGRDTTRLEAFSDGVIAIAITLLVLEIHVPEGIDAIGQPEAWQALLDHWPSYLGYLVSFATIGIMWANHHTIFRYVARTDHYLVLLNLLLLFCIGAIPFPTALVADALGHPAERVGILVYAGWFFVTAVSYNLLWRYASHDDRLFAPDADRAGIEGITARFRFGPFLYLLAFLLAFLSTPASLALLLLLALAYVLPYGSGQR